MVSAIKGMGSSPRRKKHHAGNELQLSLLTPGLEKEKNHPERLGRVSGIALPALPGTEESGLSFSEKPRRDGSPGNGDREVVGLPGRARKMEAMGTLASGIAHDFNNILTPIFLRIEMAMAQLQPDSPLRYQLEQVLTCGQRARDLVQQILNFSHQNDGERRPLQISLVVKEMVKLLRSSLPASIEIRQDIRGAGMVLADLGLIHVLVIELCIRSAHAMRGNGGFLEISLCDVELDGPGDRDLLSLPRGAYVKLSVKQTINGTPREKQRADAETDEETGPDIALIRSIVEQHGGKMVVYKEAGEGVTIHTFLPRMECKSSAKGGEPAFLPRGSESILLVDDEQAVVETLRQMLTYLGYTVVSTTSSAEALDIFRNSPKRFDVVITDQTMPRMTGVELAAEVSRIRPELPVLLCSGFDEVMQDGELGKIGVRALLVKPLTAHDIAHKIRQVLENSRNGKTLLPLN